MPDTPPDTPPPAPVTRILTAAAIAVHWHVDGSYVRRLRMETSEPRMPDFPDLGSDSPDRFKLVDEWRMAHVPPRPRRLLPDASDEKKTGGGRGAPAGSAPNNAPSSPPRPVVHNPPPEAFNFEEFDRDVGDFDAWMVREAELTAKIAVGLHRRACGTGDPVKIANALANLSDAAKRAKEMRANFARLLEESRQTISIDRAQDLLSPVLNALTARLKTMGQRIGADANPTDPVRAARAIDGEVDLICTKLAGALLALEEAKHDETVLRDSPAAPVAA